MTSLDLAGAQWRKSSSSGHDGGECVELTTVEKLIGVRDSKNPTGPILFFEPQVWASFVEQVKSSG
ncbi:DUF397 domain-containing protein [Actinomadura alba]|uniref:DUF397 domain-containing protein n=1 Tax=Actinomadura alba TaxID=406431 RepID=A0ABR7LNH3_9ACTN|nr:DUF397 domain-containing protein [Actinomadura alba]MBC6466400.1 DUF397 domain-containing protein [Actinomadura alba]